MKLSCLGALLVATFIGAAGCSSSDPSDPSDPSADDHLTESAKLSFGDVLPELAAQGISGTVRKLTDTRLSESVTPDVSPTRFSENRYYLEVSFGKLTRAQFDVIAKVFGG
ncbi:MAG TPA: hypothetical protein VM925_27485, partial [Labilithrix sp.]|nr:hypothetical protein [Labilithrix sp.]